MKRILPLLLLALLAAPNLFADGMVARKRMQTARIDEVNIPDQRALIHFTNGVERLVIETRFTGEGTNFCWVVPLPSQPVIEPSTTGLFPTLGYVLQPELVHRADELFPYLGVIVVLLYVVLLNSPRRDFKLWAMLPAVVATFVIGCFSIVAAAVAGFIVLWGTHRMSGGHTTLFGLLIGVFVISVFAAMLLPALGSRGKSIALPADVAALEHKRVGIFDVTTVVSLNANALLDWLRDNGFEAPKGTEKVVADYVKEGWVFSVAKLNVEPTDTLTNSIHPLAFTFRTPQPVYPMRLTALASKELDLELYVFGSGRAKADGLKVDQCFTLKKGGSRIGTELPAAHPELNRWSGDAPHVTKLTGQLSPAEMERDVQIRFESYSPKRSVLYSRRGAAIVAANWAFAVLLLLFGGICFVSALQSKPIPVTRIAASSFVPAALAFAVVYLALPTVRIRIGNDRFATMNWRMFTMEAADRLQDQKPGTLEQARQLIREMRPPENPWLGGVMREEDSPGNYVIRRHPAGHLEFVSFDHNGEAHRF